MTLKILTLLFCVFVISYSKSSMASQDSRSMSISDKLEEMGDDLADILVNSLFLEGADITIDNLAKAIEGADLLNAEAYLHQLKDRLNDTKKWYTEEGESIEMVKEAIGLLDSLFLNYLLLKHPED